MDINKYIQDQIQAAVADTLDGKLEEFAVKMSSQLQKPEFESWGRYLTLKQAMVYAGYSSKNGLYDFLHKYGIQKIKHSPKDVKVDRYEIDNAMQSKMIAEYKKQLAA